MPPGSIERRYTTGDPKLPGAMLAGAILRVPVLSGAGVYQPSGRYQRWYCQTRRYCMFVMS